MKLSVSLSGTEQVRRQLLRIGREAGQRALDATVVEVEDYVSEQAAKHHDTGRMERSVDKRRIQNGWEVFHDLQHAPHALFVHWGTKAHVIRPKKADGFTSQVKAHMRKGRPVREHTRTGVKAMLRWPVGGKFVFAREVHHPGNDPDPWMVRAAAQAPRIFKRHVAAQIARINNSGA